MPAVAMESNVKKILTLILGSFLFSSVAFADEKASTEENKPVANTAQSNGKDRAFSFLELSNVVGLGESVTNGDLIQVNRKFDTWNLRCDVRLSTNKHACFVEQSASFENTGIQLRIGNNIEGRTVAITKLPANFDADKGLRLKFSGLEKTLGKENFACTSDHCIGGFLLEGFVQEAILGSRYIGFVIPVKNDPEQVEIALTMSSFDEAIEAAKDPFGREISIATNERAAKDKTSEAAKPAAVAPKPVPAKKAAQKAVSAPKQQEASAVKASGRSASGLF